MTTTNNNGNGNGKRRITELAIRQKALADYRRGDHLREIAVRYGVAIGTVSIWARKAGYARRTQGCTRKLRPSVRDVEVIEAVRAVRNGKPTYEDIARRFGLGGRASVSRIFKTWNDWKPYVPFKRGDPIRFQNHDYVVVKPDVFEGKVRDVESGRVTVIPWRMGSDRAVKL